MLVSAEPNRPLGGEPWSRDRFYIGGDFVQATSKARIEVHEAATGEVLATVAEASEADIDMAVNAAADAHPAWAATPPGERADYLEVISAGIVERTEELARSIAREVGTPIRHA